MDRHTHEIDFASALHMQSDEDTVEIRTLRPHEAYKKNLAVSSSAAVDRAAPKADEP